MKYSHCLPFVYLFTVLSLILSLFSCNSPKTYDESEINSISDIINIASKGTNNLDTAIYLCDQAYHQAFKIGHDSLAAQALMMKANFSLHRGDIACSDSIYELLVYGHKFEIDSALICKIKCSYAASLGKVEKYEKAECLLSEARLYYEHKDNKYGIMLSHIFVADIYRMQLKYSEAVNALMIASEIAETLDNKIPIAAVTKQLGDVYYTEKEYDKSITYYSRAVDMYQELNQELYVANCFHNMGAVYFALEDHSKAELYFLNAKKIYDDANMIFNSIEIINNLGAVYTKQKELNKALKCYDDMLKLNKKANRPTANASAYNNIGDVYFAKKDYTKAKHYYEMASRITEKDGNKDRRLYYESMMNLNEAKRDWKQAFVWAEKFRIHSDSIFNIEKYDATEELQIKYETKKKKLLLENLEIEKERDRVTILNNRIIIIGMFAMMLLIITFSYFARKQYISKLQSYKELVKKSREITAINKTKRQQALSTQNHTTISPSPTKESPEKLIIPEEVIESIKIKLNELIDSKFYTNTGLSLNGAAAILNTNPRYLSQFINDTFDSNFPTFINQLRIEEAQRLLKDTSFDNLTIEVIGQEAGFKSKSAFNSAFKKETGITPSFYKKEKE